MRIKTNAMILAAILSVLLGICHACGPGEIPKNRMADMELFIRNAVKDQREEDFRRHNIDISVIVIGMKIDKITRKETSEDNEYFVRGKVSYMIKGNRKWKDKDGNIVELGPEQEITRWFSCGILEDRYNGLLFKDNKNALAFYADSPIQ